MKKITLTILTLALVFTTFAQIDTSKRFRVSSAVGFVNIRAGAGMSYAVIDTRDNHTVVYRNFSEQITNGWVPVVYRGRTLVHWLHRGYIHENRLVPFYSDFYLEHSSAFQIVLPKASDIDMEKRTQLQQMANDNNAVIRELRHDTVFHKPCHRNVEVLLFDDNGRLRRYFWDFAVSRGVGEFHRVAAYFNENGELINLFNSRGSNEESVSERLFLHERRIVDFQIRWGCIRCKPNRQKWSKDAIDVLRSQTGGELTKTLLDKRPLTDFLDAQTLLQIVRNENYRGQMYRWREIMGWGSEMD